MSFNNLIRLQRFPYSNSNIVASTPATVGDTYGSIVSSNVAQNAVAANVSRSAPIIFTNTSNSVMFLSMSGTATTADTPCYPQQTIEFPYTSTNALSVICDTATSTFKVTQLTGSSLSGGVSTISANLTLATSSSVSINSTIITGGTAQPVVALNLSRKYLEFYNNSAVTMYISITTAGVASTGIPVAAGGGYFTPPNVVPTGQINVMCSLTAAKYTYVEYV